MSNFLTKPDTRLKAVYAHLDCFLTGVERLHAANIEGFEIAAPVPRHEILDVAFRGRPAPVRWWTLCGAMTGVTFGFLLPALTHSQWPMINPGGKPVVSLLPFAIIMFESTIMLGCLATAAGMFFHCGLPSFFLNKSLQDPRFTDDKFGIVFLDVDPEERDRISDILHETGAIEVTSGQDTVYEVPNA